MIMNNFNFQYIEGREITVQSALILTTILAESLKSLSSGFLVIWIIDERIDKAHSCANQL